MCQRKCRHCWALLARELVLVVQLKSLMMWTPRNLVLITLSTVEPFMHGWKKQQSQRSSILFCQHSQTACYYCTSLWAVPPPLFMMFELDLAVQLWISSMNSSGLSTQPLRAPVLRVMVVEVLLGTWTDWIQLESEVLKPSRSSLSINCWWMMGLNAKLNSMNNILFYVLFLSRFCQVKILERSWRSWVHLGRRHQCKRQQHVVESFLSILGWLGHLATCAVHLWCCWIG